MINFIGRKKPESGRVYLKKAVEKGHAEAKYVYGIILIRSGGEQREQGLRLLSSLNLTSCSETCLRIVNFRLKIEEILRLMKWFFPYLAEPKKYLNNNVKPFCCHCDDHNIMQPILNLAWEAHNPFYHNLHCCLESCFWNREATLFCNMLGI